MAINSKHPKYVRFADLYWKKCLHLYEGEEVVKEHGVTYLPATPGQVLDGMTVGQEGYKNYQAYKERAPVPDFFKEAVGTFAGMMHEKPATIELPEKMKYLMEKATPAGESLLALLRRINEKQLVSGRLGLLCDFPTAESVEPQFYIALYEELSPINWDSSSNYEDKDELNLVVLDETAYERDAEYNWVSVEKYRILELKDGNYNVRVSRDMQVGEGSPVLVRGEPLKFIPFVFCNSCDILPEPDQPPLIGLVRLCFTIYKGEADYRQSLFMQGQDTLVVIGGSASDSTRIGAGAKIDVDVNGDAKFIGVNSAGLPEQRMALENDKGRAGQMAGKLVSGTKSSQESGEALKTRIAAQTATLNIIAKTGALALETALRFIARAIGEDESKVVVKPNLEFAALNLMGDDLVKIMVAKSTGAPLSLESIHALLQERGLTVLEYQAEIDKIKAEPVLVEPVKDPNTKAAGVDSQLK